MSNGGAGQRFVQQSRPSVRYGRHVIEAVEQHGQGQLKCLAVSGGEVYVCDIGNYRVVMFGLDGSFVWQWGTEGSGEGRFHNPTTVVVNGDEVLVMSNNRVQVFGLDGSFVRQWGSEGDGAGQFIELDSIAVSEGEVFVSSRHCVQVFQ